MHWCSQQRGHPGIPLEQYGTEDLKREYESLKPCAPFCTVGCVHRVAQLDELRENPLGTLADWFRPAGTAGPRQLPVSVKVLTWALVTNGQRDTFRKAALRLLRVK